MDYALSDSSGTDDDLPPPHRNRFQRGGRAASSTRPMMPGAAPLPVLHGDMETQIHLIEQEAYCSVIRAFKAQSDAISWEKEGLITELRKELRVSDEEHRELLSRVNADETIRRIREWRKTNGPQPQPVVFSSSQPIREGLPSPAVSASRKKQKTSQPVASLSMGAPPAHHPPTQQPSGALRRGPPPIARSKKPKTSVQHPSPSPGLAGRPHGANPSSLGGLASNEPAGAATYDPLIGKKVWTRWPDDNNFYEAVITDYNPAEGRHALVYDINTANETWEWVNLKEIPSDDIRWENEDPGVSRRGNRPGPARGIKKSMLHGSSAAGPGRGRGTNKSHSKDVPSSQNGVGKKALGDIQILHTDTLVKEVERVIGLSPPDPAEIEKAKKALKEHEQALVDAIAKLEEASDGESGRWKVNGSMIEMGGEG